MEEILITNKMKLWCIDEMSNKLKESIGHDFLSFPDSLLITDDFFLDSTSADLTQIFMYRVLLQSICNCIKNFKNISIDIVFKTKDSYDLEKFKQGSIKPPSYYDNYEFCAEGIDEFGKPNGKKYIIKDSQ